MSVTFIKSYYEIIKTPANVCEKKIKYYYLDAIIFLDNPM